MLKLGKKPAREGAVRLRLRDYVDLSRLPTPPAEFGHDRLVTKPLGMLGNDSWGDCVWAGAAHETMLWNREAGKDVTFTTACVLSDYSSVTGFNQSDPSTDNGTDIQAAAAYRQKTGVLDANGSRHKIGAYLSIEAGNVAEHLVACYVFSVVGVGIIVTQSAMGQFNNGQPWSPISGSPIEGGHYVPMVARRGGMCIFETWGTEQPATDAFISASNDESIVYLSPEMLSGGKSLEGFDLDHLKADMAELQQ